MLFRILHDERSGELSYLLADTHAHEAVVIDPHSRVLPVVLALLEDLGLRLRRVLRTHQHDAIQPMEFDSLSRLGVPMVQGAARAGAQKGFQGLKLAFGRETVSVLATPGHTPRADARIAPGAARGAGAPAGEGLTSTHSAIIE